MSDQATITPAFLEIIKTAILKKGISVPNPFSGIAVWDDSGYCRVYSTTQVNFHFGVYFLDKKNYKFSVPFTMNNESL